MEKIEITFALPCLNEERTVGQCVREIHQTMARTSISYEVLVCDNASDDASAEVARSLGARVVSEDQRGYGNACIQSFRHARGEYILMADADMSYDFREAHDFLRKAREGFDLVIGSRFLGSMESGAMPWLHRHIGTPLLTRMINLCFRSRFTDSQSGMRLLRAEAFRNLGLRSPGMEFASEMLARASLASLRIAEIPVHFRKDRRERAPHLKPLQDGWRHFRFLLLFVAAS